MTVRADRLTHMAPVLSVSPSLTTCVMAQREGIRETVIALCMLSIWPLMRAWHLGIKKEVNSCGVHFECLRLAGVEGFSTVHPHDLWCLVFFTTALKMKSSESVCLNQPVIVAGFSSLQSYLNTSRGVFAYLSLRFALSFIVNTIFPPMNDGRQAQYVSIEFLNFLFPGHSGSVQLICCGYIRKLCPLNV